MAKRSQRWKKKKGKKGGSKMIKNNRPGYRGGRKINDSKN